MFIRLFSPRSLVILGRWATLLAGLVGAVRAQTNYATPYAFVTLAGTPGAYGSSDTGFNTRFNDPEGVAMDAAGNLYIADSNNYTVRKITASGVATTLAGAAGQTGHDDGAGSTARFSLFGGIAVDSAGTIYVTDILYNTVRKITSGGVVSTLAGTWNTSGTTDAAGAAARFSRPTGIAVDSSGNIFVSDNFNNTIRRITPAGVVTTFAGIAGNAGSTDGLRGSFNGPQGLAFDGAGNLYVADSTNDTVRKITPTGVISTAAGTAGRFGGTDGPVGQALFSGPSGITVDAGGNIYVSDGLGRIRKIAGGNVTTIAGSATTGSSDGTGAAAHFSFLNGALTTDSSGNLYLADSYNDTIRKITPAGVVTTFAGLAGIPGSTNNTELVAQFYHPLGVAVDSSGTVYVADADNATIRKISAAGVVSTLAGSPGVTGSTDGTGATARFSSPQGVALDAAGNLYVADSANHIIRKITPAGLVSTLAGSAGLSGSTNGTGAVARFSYPAGVAVDAAGTVYVAEAGNYTIRKIAAGAVVSTLAGLAGNRGSTDGTGSVARFSAPSGLAVDAAGNVYVADTSNNLIRKITPAGVTTTLTGATSALNNVDGTLAAARFFRPFSVAIDGASALYVSSGQAVRKITAAGVVTTLAGSDPFSGTTDGTGSAARFNNPYGVAVDTAGHLYVTDQGNHALRIGSQPTAPKIPTVTVPLLIPGQPAPTTVDSRALAEQPGGGVIVGISGSYPVRPNAGAALLAPDYVNPQPYNLSYVVRLLANGQPDPAFTSAPGSDGTVNTVVVQPDKKILVGGTFTTFQRIVFRNLARLLPTGEADTTFVLGSGFASPAGVSAQVNALALQSDGSIVVGGAFQTFGNVAHPYLARLTSAGLIDATFSPVLNGVVNALAIQPDGKILVGGNFTSVGGTARARVARLLANGALDPSFNPGTGADNEVVSLALQADGAVLVGGDFTAFAGQNRQRLVRLLSTGAIDPAFSIMAGANDTVISLGLEAAAGKILLGGAFTQVNGVTRNRLARLLVDGSIDLSFEPGDGANDAVRAILPRSDGTIFLGGIFNQYQDANVDEVVAITGTPVTAAFVHMPQSATVNVGGSVTLVADAIGTGLSYQWFKDGVAITGATQATLTLSNVAASAQGRYTVRIMSSDGTLVTSDVATLTVNAAPVVTITSAVTNVSVRTTLSASQTLIVGFTMNGGSKPVLVRAVGPGLANFGVSGVMADPKLTLFKDSTLLETNDDWGGGVTLTAAFLSVGAFPLTANSKDAALQRAIEGGHTAQITGPAGNVLVEAYDAGTGFSPRFSNVSARNRVGTGGDILIAGFTISGTASKNLLIRAVGPTLAVFGVTGPLADPKLEVYSGTNKIAENDSWAPGLTSVFTSVGAFALTPGSKDAALMVTLAPGGYTVQVSGADGGTGEALVELYELP